jgi:hypothetical protein
VVTTSLLARINKELAGERRGWSDVIVVKNVGPLVTARPLQGDAISNRGFNVFLLDGRGLPSHFAKIRPADYEGFRREAELTVSLSRNEASRRLVPNAKTFVEISARILLEDYIDGVMLEAELRSMGASQWCRAAADVLVELIPIWDALAATVHGFPRVVDSRPVLDDLRLLESLGLDVAVARRFARRMTSVRLVGRPQHGDLWPINVMRTNDGWRVIDFESCGLISIPLYDVFHLVRGCGQSAGGGIGDWFEQWQAAGKKAQRLNAAVRRIATDMNNDEISAAMVTYLVDFTARLYRRGVSRERTAARMREIKRLDEWLAQGGLSRILDSAANA